MKAVILFLQAIMIFGFIYCQFYLPQTNSDGRSWNSAFTDEALSFEDFLHPVLKKHEKPQEPTPTIETKEEIEKPKPLFREGDLFCRQKDQRRNILCKLTNRDCIRYTPTQELEHFWMICALYTPNQANTAMLYELHRNFLNYSKLFGFQVQVIEVVFPGQEYQATRPNHEPYELQYTADWIFNMRENLVNVGAKHLPADWEYISWIDAHIFWDENRYFFEDVIIELGKNNIVHMLESNDFYGENNKTHFYEDGVAKLWSKYHTTRLNPIRQCGMAWATRRDIFEATHGSLDVCIGTKCDLYQNYAYFGEVYTGECSNPEYAKAVREWQTRAISVYKKKVGYVRGNIVHFEHCLASRGCRTSNYDSMTQTLMRHNFNPNTDMKRDAEGRMQFQSNFELAKDLWKIYGGSEKLRR